MTKCSKCQCEKSENEFNFNKSKNRLEYHCKSCHSDYLKNHYTRKKQYYKDKAKKWKEELRQWLREIKLELKCENCPENHVACLDFHHSDPSAKDGTISCFLQQGKGKDRILEEIAKCKVLCSNCHRKLHWGIKESLL